MLGLLAPLGVTACRPEQTSREQLDGTVMSQREARTRRLARTDGIPVDQPIARWLLPPSMAEISGLALDSAGRLFGHDDDRGRVFEIDFRGGGVRREFRVAPVADFEGLTAVGDQFYMITSNGKVYSFREGDHNRVVETAVHDLQLGRECEFEGITWDARDSSLVLPCKNVGDARDNRLVMYRWWPGRRGQASLSRTTTALAATMEEHEWREFEPTDITVDPVTGNFVLLAGRQQAIMEVSPSGDIVNVTALPGDFAQAEGIAITRDGLLIIASEGVNGPAVVAVFRRAVAGTPGRAPR